VAERLPGPQPRDAGSEREQFLALLSGKWIVQAIATAAELGVADALDEPRSIDELAAMLSCQPAPLARVLRVLVGEGLLERESHGDYALTPLGKCLRSGEMRTLAQFVGSHSQWHPWPALPEAVRTGRSAFELTHGQSLFSYLETTPEEARLYDEAVDTFTLAQAEALATLPIIGEEGTVVDVGGGRGTLLLEVLRSRPRLKGVLLDRPHVVEATRQRFLEAGLNERCEMLGGDFFANIPSGADYYVLKHVLHNWSDEQALRLLNHCRSALGPSSQLLIVEGVLLPGNLRDLTSMMDLEMMVLTGEGRERSKPEFRRLLGQARLELTHMAPLSLGARVLVAKARG
jgi:DNA-binding HxlR family transcriptional regulator